MPLDLARLTPAATVRIPLDHPFDVDADGAPVPLADVAFVLAGHHTAESREHFLARADADLAEGEAPAAPSLRRALADQRATVLALLKGIEGLEHEGRALTPADLTPDFIAAHPALPRLLEQAFGKYAEVGGFFDRRRPDSSPTPSTSTPSTGA